MATEIKLYSGTSWAGVITDGSNITVECYGAGGVGGYGYTYACRGGGGGAYSRSSIAYESGTSRGISVHPAGNPTYDCYFRNANYSYEVLAKKGGDSHEGDSNSGRGGAAASGIGDVKYSGANGSEQVSYRGGAGGAGAGPNGNGGSGGGYSGTGGAGGNRYYAGAAGNDYGGGGGGGGREGNNTQSSNGAASLIVITYTEPSAGVSKLKTLNGLVVAKFKTWNGLDWGKSKTFNGLT